MRDGHPDGPTGYVCPRCGGALSQRTNGNGRARFDGWGMPCLPIR